MAERRANVLRPTARFQAGGSDYYESAVVRPDLVLADLVAIVHPDKMPGHKFYYYRQLK